MKAIILAAGEGKRMNSKLPKVLHEVLGKSMISHVISTAKKAGAEQCIVVVGHKAEKVKEKTENMYEDLFFVEQKEQKGTGHAVMMAKDFLEEETEVLILYGDVPLIKEETLIELSSYHKEAGNSVTVVSTYVEDPTGYGRIIRTENSIAIVEHRDATQQQREINEINTGIYIFKAKALRDAISELKNDNSQEEYYLTDTLEIISRKGERVSSKVFEDSDEFLGVNNREQLSDVSYKMKHRINKKHMENGVTIIDSNTTYISPEVTIGMDSIIFPNTMLEGHTSIGENCMVGPNCKITNTEIKDNVKFEYSVCTDSKIGNNTAVGPFAYLRPNSVVGENCKIGDFVEVKNSEIGNNTKVSHLTYIGDSDVGNNINVGCGTVTVNYDGKRKDRTVIEDDAFIGCNANLIAPVTVKKGAFVAAGSTVTMDVPENSLAVARVRQSNKLNWNMK